MTKRILSIILTLALCLAFLPVKAHAEPAPMLEMTGVQQDYLAGGTFTAPSIGLTRGGSTPINDYSLDEMLDVTDPANQVPVTLTTWRGNTS